MGKYLPVIGAHTSVSEDEEDSELWGEVRIT
jgi:hypothetical protein